MNNCEPTSEIYTLVCRAATEVGRRVLGLELDALLCGREVASPVTLVTQPSESVSSEATLRPPYESVVETTSIVNTYIIKGGR